ncbi:preprotein translocase subunit SecE [Globicatella sulfidifaciens]|uniref:preprotein translocase subunit SecE n=1 Tax=Globicatella sulfidifaciens TaxID=136093 RepID=UPI0028909A7B|nr:preprotein translocase subunit SecE [Globicatella sulfidifaciens]MDT2768448.1 preprotein translocase subunit SecE [Globicatella sulfidifaciens]
MGYIKGVFEELKRVNWPSLGEISKYTWTVIVMIILFGLYFAGVDTVFANLINWLVSL